MKSTITFLTLIAFSICGYTQNYYEEFVSAFQNGNEVKQLEILQEWEKLNPENAELFTCYFNYYINKSMEEVLSMSQEAMGEEALVLTDSIGKTVGYVGSDIIYHDNFFDLGVKKINKGIELYPNRLDMRFGKIYAYGQKEDWDNFTKEIITTIQYSVKNKNKWTWTFNEKYSGEAEFLLSLQDYQSQLFNTGNDDLLANMKMIANEVLKHYPKNIESLSNLSVTYLLTKEYDKALEIMFKAEKINPKDYIVLSNIAYAYKLKGNKEKAIEYYQKTIKYGDEEAIRKANQELVRLKKNL